jgi:hypothetical protein
VNGTTSGESHPRTSQTTTSTTLSRRTATSTTTRHLDDVQRLRWSLRITGTRPERDRNDGTFSGTRAPRC